MLSDKPYLIRAFYDWIVDSNCTPYITVDVHCEGVEVPMEYVEDGKITLNIAKEAVSELHLGNRFIKFSARFSGRVLTIKVPLLSVSAIYASENGRGMMFEMGDEMEYEDFPPEDDDNGGGSGNGPFSGSKRKGSHLTVVK